MHERMKHFGAAILLSAVTGAAVWAVLHLTAPKRRTQSADYLQSNERTSASAADLWSQGVEELKADRGEPVGGSAAVQTPTELQHYSDKHWFLATQVAEVRENNIQTCQDFVDLAAMIERGEMVAVPAVTETYILFGVGANADDEVFTRYQDDHGIGLYNDAQLHEEYARLDVARSNLQSQIGALKAQLSALKKRDRTKQHELQKEITTRQQQLKTADDSKVLLDRFYGQPESRSKLFGDYDSLQGFAKNFGGRSYNLDDSSDRQAMKINMLRSLRPEALKVLQEVAQSYHDKFDRPLPVSSLVRPEQYQHALNKVNRNAVLIDTPPHSTGLAFDIDYRYMSAAEQSFVMNELARVKDDGRIEAIRERNANYHVFVFVDGKRPSDELIAASLDQASAPVKEANHASKKPAKAKSKSQKGTKANVKTKARKRR